MVVVKLEGRHLGDEINDLVIDHMWGCGKGKSTGCLQFNWEARSGHWRSTRKLLEGRRELRGAMKGESGPGFTVRKWRGS